MFVAIRDDKIVAYNESGVFNNLVYDEVKEIDDIDLIMVGAEFLPLDDERVIVLQKTEKSNQIKSIRNQYLSDTLSRCDRYEKQKSGLLPTTDTYDTYLNLLKYLQYLRDVPQQLEFPNIEVLTFDKWSVNLTL